MSLLRRLSLGFPTSWSHQRVWSLDSVCRPGEGTYFVDWDPGSGTYGEDFDGAPRDEAGVLLSGPRGDYHPIRIAQFALHRFGIWRSADERAARSDFLAQAKWLRDRQEADGTPGLYRFDFPWARYGAAPGWSSAMAQGEAISVLLRAHAIDPRGGFGDAAVRASLPFQSSVAGGGVVWRSGDEVFLEEIANEHAPHVLNGCIFALWGLWELWMSVGDRSLQPLIERCVTTLRRWLPRYDTGWWTLYSLMMSANDQPHIATLKYHRFHIAQMRVLARMFDEPLFDDTASRWTSYVESPDCRARLLRETIFSLPERFLKRDTVLGGAHT
jgi:heparosan-N-sulfate-glucuronate 5-epimerase